MRSEPKRDEYRIDGKEATHVPTGIRVTLDFQNEAGDWTVGYMMGNPGRYDEGAVVTMGARLLLG